MSEAVIVGATRTPIGSFLGSLGQVPAVSLGATVLRALLTKTGINHADIDEVIMGHVLTAGLGQNTSRQAAIAAGLPVEVPALTINRVCGSGLSAVVLAAQAIRAGDAKIVLAGGMESMSLAPHVLPAAIRTGIRMGSREILDSMLHDGLWDIFNDYHMGITAENVAARYGISREQQDAYSLGSQQRAAAAVQAGRFQAEITPVEVPQRKGPPVTVSLDEQPRPSTTLAQLQALKSAFKSDGSVTAGNSSTINDGAAAVVVMSDVEAQERQLPILARIVSYATAGVEPAFMGCGPISATKLCLKKAGWKISSLDLIEANEAFAAQFLAVGQELAWNSDIVNVNGGAIALGHPIGASGCRVLVSLIYEMQHRNVQRGLATLCIGGGQGVAMAITK